MTTHLPRAAVLAIVALTLGVTACGDAGNSIATADTDTVAPPDDTADDADAGDDDTTAPMPTECTADQACQAGNTAPPCQQFACLNGVCERVPVDDGASCAPVDRCLLPGTCQGGFCIAAGPRTCGDSNPCTDDSCDPAVGCVSVPNDDGNCSDGDACTLGDRCVDGGCVGGVEMACDDGDLCTTDDRCVDGACTATPTGPCDDDDPCTVNDACVSATGLCAGEVVGTCECSEDTDCAVLEDGDLCNGTLVCGADQRCEIDPETVVTCPEATALCQAIACEPTTGMCMNAYEPAGTPCSHVDDDCLLPSVCDDSGGCGVEPMVCDDDDPCTADACVAGSCEFVNDPNCLCLNPPCDNEPGSMAGDALILKSFSSSVVETVGMATLGDLLVTCGGFGMDIFNAGNDTMTHIGGVAGVPRCQNVVLGPMTADGDVLAFVNNHGDAYVPTPALYVVPINPTTFALKAPVSTLALGVSVEGLHWDDNTGTLLVAAHGDGVRRYALDDETLKLTVIETHPDAAENAWRLTRFNDTIVIADGQFGVKLRHASDLSYLADIDTAGFAKDVVVVNGFAYVVVSSLGLEVWDINDPLNPTLAHSIFTHGSTLDVTAFAGGDYIAVANWQDVTIIDTKAAPPGTVAIDRGGVTNAEPRVLAVTGSGSRLFYGDWLGLGEFTFNPIFTGPEFTLDRTVVQVPNVAPLDTVVTTLGVTNRGALPLEITNVASSNATVWSVTPTSATIPPGMAQAFELTFAPISTSATFDTLSFATNDPDEPVVAATLWGNPSTTGKLGVGDALTDAFDFLDVDNPPGMQSIGNLDGHVVVLAYFATF